ncbi:MAG TPA: AMP-binding protein, partial [Terriglobales bacterium]|nr:AMP-binding protein [Terriglobales bacterium]
FCLRKGLELAGIRHVYVGGAPVFPPQTEAAQRVMPNAEIVCVYGSSEAEPIAHVARSEITENDPHRMFSGCGILAGRPIPEIKLRILNDRWGEPVGAYSAAEFDAASLGPGATGEIVISGDHVLPGYLNGEGDRETKFRVGDTVWHRTGDAGYLDGEGRLWLLGRCAARVRDEHGLIYPLSVECAISDFSCVRRAALLQRNGQRILAIEPHSRISTHDVALLKARLGWAGISEIRAVPHIPVDRRHNSKIDYTALAEMMEVGSEQR